MTSLQPPISIYAAAGTGLFLSIVMTVGSVGTFLLRDLYPLNKRPTVLMCLINLMIVLENLWNAASYLKVLPCLIVDLFSDQLVVCALCCFFLNIGDTYLVWRLNTIKTGFVTEDTIPQSDRSHGLGLRLERLRRFCRPRWALAILGAHITVVMAVAWGGKFLLDREQLLLQLAHNDLSKCNSWKSRPIALALLGVESLVFGSVVIAKFRRNLYGRRDNLGVRVGILGLLTSLLARFFVWGLMAFVIVRWDGGVFSYPIVIFFGGFSNFVGWFFFSGLPTVRALRARKRQYQMKEGVELKPLVPLSETEAPAVPTSLLTRIRSNRNRVASIPRKVNFGYFIEEPDGREAFLAYLVTEWNSENLLFLMDVNQFIAAMPSERIAIVAAIHTTYFEPDAVNSINVEGELIATLRSGAAQVQAGTLVPDDDFYAAAFASIRRLLFLDCFPRFQASPEFREFLLQMPDNAEETILLSPSSDA